MYRREEFGDGHLMIEMESLHQKKHQALKSQRKIDDIRKLLKSFYAYLFCYETKRNVLQILNLNLI